MWKYHQITLVEHRASSFLLCPLSLLIAPSLNPLCAGYNKNKENMVLL